MTETTRVKPQRCLNCPTMLDAISDLLGEAVPTPGDYTICLRCGHLMVLGENLELCEPSGEEMLAIAGDPKLIKLQHARGMAMNPRGNVGAVIRKPHHPGNADRNRRARQAQLLGGSRPLELRWKPRK